MSERVLDVYLQEKLVGQLRQGQSGALDFTYAEAFLSSSPIGISLSLPLQDIPHEGNNVKSYFSGLLPDESVRDRLAKYLGLSEQNPFALLEAIGGDCAGALALYPQGQKPLESNEDDIEVLDDYKLKEILELIKRRPMLAGDEGYRLSLAGAQNKLAVGFENNKVILIKGGTPTTHILKPLIDHISDSAHNELFCMRLAKMMDIDVPFASLHYVDDTPYYLVKRYDRIIHENGSVSRIHQEDFCQALGIAPEIKYEREGGPNLAQCQELIRENSIRPAVDQIKFLNTVMFNYFIGNNDAHGKNFSLLYSNIKPELAPAYDLLSTAIYPALSPKMAMKIGGKYNPRDVYLRHWYRILPDTKAAQSRFEKQLNTMAQKIQTNARSLKKQLNEEGLNSSVYDDISAMIQDRCNRI